MDVSVASLAFSEHDLEYSSSLYACGKTNTMSFCKFICCQVSTCLLQSCSVGKKSAHRQRYLDGFRAQTLETRPRLCKTNVYVTLPTETEREMYTYLQDLPPFPKKLLLLSFPSVFSGRRPVGSSIGLLKNSVHHHVVCSLSVRFAVGSEVVIVAVRTATARLCRN